jgi:glycosyltransferase involved in cell wall biosynthesis
MTRSEASSAPCARILAMTEMPRSVVSIIVPVYFNEATLPALGERFAGYLESRPDVEWELVLVDDGSEDGSWREIEKAAGRLPRVIALRLTRNFGSHAAIQAGLDACTGDAAAVMAADLQEPKGLVPEMVDAWRKGTDLVLATREGRPEGALSTLLANFYYRTLHRLAFQRMPTGGFDVYLVSRRAIEFLRRVGEIHTSLPGLLLWSGYSASLVPYVRQPRSDKGRSRWTLGKKAKLFIDSVTAFSFAPIRWVTYGGAALAAAAFLYALALIAIRLFRGAPLRGWTSLMVALTFFSGVQLISIGILGEYLWRTYDAARRRPPYLVDRTVRSGKAEHAPSPADSLREPDGP